MKPWLHFILSILLITFTLSCIRRDGTQKSTNKNIPEKPSLIVLLIVDQMRADFLDRFSAAFRKNSSSGEPEGLQFFYERGTAFVNARTASAPTVTAAGHATVCSGVTASKHGIVANSYYDRSTRRQEEIAVDSSTTVVRTPDILPKDPLSQIESPGSSDLRLLSPNLSDALNKWSGGQSRTVAVSIKNRGAVYCGGKHSAGVYWYDYLSGSMVTSSRYSKVLPDWVDRFNTERRPNFNYVWKPSFSGSQLKGFLGEERFKRALDVRSALSQKFGQGFPYAYSSSEIGAIGARKFFEYTPSASDYLVEFALAAQNDERLGCAQKIKNKSCTPPQFPDLLTVSFSTPDLVGHGFGPESVEHFDIYLNLNKSIERLRKELEARLGQGNILFVQTSDHGVQSLPEVIQSVSGKSAGRLSNQEIKRKIEEFLNTQIGPGEWIDAVINGQIYFNHKLLVQNKLTLDTIVLSLKPLFKSFPGIRDIISSAELAQGGSNELDLYKRGLHPARSGDALFLVAEGWLIEEGVAGNHGTSHDDDTRIPLVFSGWRIPQQKLQPSARADDIAPTILGLIGASRPTVMTGTSLTNLIFEKGSK